MNAQKKVSAMLEEFKNFAFKGNVVDLAIGVIIGAAFGNKSISKQRTEMVIFMTPHVIYDTNQLVEASDQLKSGFKRLNKIVRE